MEKKDKLALLERLVKEGSITLEEAFGLMNEQIVINLEVNKHEPIQVPSPTIAPFWWQYQVSGGTTINPNYIEKSFLLS